MVGNNENCHVRKNCDSAHPQSVKKVFNPLDGKVLKIDIHVDVHCEC